MPTVHSWIGVSAPRGLRPNWQRNMAVLQGNCYCAVPVYTYGLRHCTDHVVGLQDIHPPGRPVAEHGDRYPQETQTIDGRKEKCAIY